MRGRVLLEALAAVVAVPLHVVGAATFVPILGLRRVQRIVPRGTLLEKRSKGANISPLGD